MIIVCYFMLYTSELLKLISKKYREQETAFVLILFFLIMFILHIIGTDGTGSSLNKEIESNVNYQFIFFEKKKKKEKNLKGLSW